MKEWHFADKVTLKLAVEQTSGVTSLFLDDEFLFSGSHDRNIRIYKNLELKQVLEGHKGTIWGLLSDNTTLYSASNDHTVRVWDLETHACTHVLESDNKIFGLQMNRDRLFSYGGSSVRLWNRSQLKWVTDIKSRDEKGLPMTNSWVNAISLRDHHLVTGSSDSHMRIWDIEKGECQSTVTTGNTILALTSTHDMIFTAHQNCSIQVCYLFHLL
eukprot:TRINITY_DN4370_c0_g1_i2.p1 TRINITY_DN4370_c0_g1~~TRINITY_DN4370_c0_g1_i2.p1  ORF type:complete len:214 (+),score=29.13 TRINITY_DN4370_c0_g1_i2:269-910(+)